ncbi:c-type cytochrome [Imhoffiella purpurea]|uniref:Cytochrome c553 n=1 Tax=Imhoffiella purpurea TaxID=1249627 RepID=W9VHL4_9GAMM|nr:c-type cytochrome [Imhoffiella purpurea]EXJ16491.1 Cytochrome c553 [Imhoffiella purpurea]
MQSFRLASLASLAFCLFTTHSALAEDAAGYAKQEYDRVMSLTPRADNGRQVFLTCAVCHGPEGWGTADGAYPQIAGQLNAVLVKQLADIRAGVRENPLMLPFALPRILGGPQNIADVAAYVSALPMTGLNGRGPGVDLDLGRRIYEASCAECHGQRGEGVAERISPALAGQHFQYLTRQFEAIRSGLRRDPGSEMCESGGFSPRESSAVLDYASRLPVAEEKLADEGWTNPDFPDRPGDRASVPPLSRISVQIQGQPLSSESH